MAPDELWLLLDTASPPRTWHCEYVWPHSVLRLELLDPARSFASLYQHPPGGRRTRDEENAFKRAITVMGDLYASAIGTTVRFTRYVASIPLLACRLRVSRVLCASHVLQC